MTYNGTLNDYEKVFNSCTICIVLFVVAFLIIICISGAYFYFDCYLKKRDIETAIYYIQMVNIKEINIKDRTYYFF